MSAPLSNRLPVLANAICAAHRLVRASAAETATFVVSAGNSLIEAKGLLSHGDWGAWLAANTNISERTATNYMRIARAGLKSETVADLGLRGALAFVARPPKRAKYQFWRPHTAAEYKDLRDSIDSRGVTMAVHYDQDGEIIDGHGRVRACGELGITDWPRQNHVCADLHATFSLSRSLNMYCGHASVFKSCAIEEIDPSFTQRALENLTPYGPAFWELVDAFEEENEDIRQGWRFRAAERSDPGITKRVLDGLVAAGVSEAMREKFWEAISAQVQQSKEAA